jgi:hypothetical protein
MVWKKQSLQGTDRYTVITEDIDNIKITKIILVSSYVAEETKIITLKPINR